MNVYVWKSTGVREWREKNIENLSVLSVHEHHAIPPSLESERGNLMDLWLQKIVYRFLGFSFTIFSCRIHFYPCDEEIRGGSKKMHEFYVVCDTSCHITWNTAYFLWARFSIYLSIFISLCEAPSFCFILRFMSEYKCVVFTFYGPNHVAKHNRGLVYFFMKKLSVRMKEEIFANKFGMFFALLM